MLEVRNLHKTFGETRALESLNFTIKSGEIMGLIGQNGSGKTTTFRLILNLLQQDQGKVLWKGNPLTKLDFNAIGYLPEERGLYPKMTIEEQIIYFSELRGRRASVVKSEIDQWMEKFNVKGKKKDLVKTLSKGNQQKVQLICTLIHKPKLIILDEPFSGLDPVNADLLIKGVFEARNDGASVIFSSHNMNNVEELCDKLIMLKDGRQILNGSVRDIRLQSGRTRLTIEGSDLLLSDFRKIPGVISTTEDQYHVKHLILKNDQTGKEVFDLVTRNAGGYVPVFNQQPPTLDEIFKEKVGEKYA